MDDAPSRPGQHNDEPHTSAPARGWQRVSKIWHGLIQFARDAHLLVGAALALVAALATIAAFVWPTSDAGGSSAGTKASNAREARITQKQTDRYRRAVGQVCQTSNREDLTTSELNAKLDGELRAATTTRQQRNTLLNHENRILDASEHALIRFEGLHPPDHLRREHDQVAEWWQQSLDRRRDYAQRLDQAANRDQLLEAIEMLSSIRPELRRDRVAVSAGLEHLGLQYCVRIRVASTPVVTLPVPPAEAMPALAATPPAASPRPPAGPRPAEPAAKASKKSRSAQPAPTTGSSAPSRSPAEDPDLTPPASVPPPRLPDQGDPATTSDATSPGSNARAHMSGRDLIALTQDVVPPLPPALKPAI